MNAFALAQTELDLIRGVFKRHPSVTAAYLFGSAPNSDNTVRLAVTTAILANGCKSTMPIAKLARSDRIAILARCVHSRRRTQSWDSQDSGLRGWTVGYER